MCRKVSSFKNGMADPAGKLPSVCAIWLIIPSFGYGLYPSYPTGSITVYVPVIGGVAIEKNCGSPNVCG
jgi:hypothetical protein